MQIKLVKQGKSKIELIKLIRWLTSLGLKECNDIVNNIPSVFEIKDKNIKFEQIEKNFSSIGALIEIEDAKKPDMPVGGVGTVEEEIVEKEAEINRRIIIKDKKNKKKIKKEKTDNEYFKSINEKADTYALVRGIKTSLSVTFIGALIHTYLIFFFNLEYNISYLVIFAVAISNAIILKKETDKENTSIAKIAAGITFFFYMASSLMKNLFFAYIYNLSIGIGGFIFGIFSFNFIVILLAMGVSYFLVAKKNPIDAIARALKKSNSYKTTNKNYTSNKENEYSRKRKLRSKKKKKF